MPGPGNPILVQNCCNSHQHKPVIPKKVIRLISSNSQMFGSTKPIVGSDHIIMRWKNGQSNNNKSPNNKMAGYFFGLAITAETSSCWR